MINYAMLRNSDHYILGVGAVADLSDMEDMARIRSAYIMEVDADITENIEKYFYDGKAFQLKPPKPIEIGDWHFDNTALEWVDISPPPIPLTLGEIKAQKWAEIRSERDRLEFGGFEFEGRIYDSDLISQGRIASAASYGQNLIWTLQDNTRVALSGSDLQRLNEAIGQHVAYCHEVSQLLRAIAFSATSVEEVQAVTFNGYSK